MREVLEEFNLFTPQPQHVQCSPYATSQSESADKKSVKCNLIRSCVVQCGVISSNRVTVAVVVTGSLFNSESEDNDIFISQHRFYSGLSSNSNRVDSQIILLEDHQKKEIKSILDCSV